jgi:hypothetical protein
VELVVLAAQVDQAVLVDGVVVEGAEAVVLVSYTLLQPKAFQDITIGMAAAAAEVEETQLLFKEMLVLVVGVVLVLVRIKLALVRKLVVAVERVTTHTAVAVVEVLVAVGTNISVLVAQVVLQLPVVELVDMVHIHQTTQVGLGEAEAVLVDTEQQAQLVLQELQELLRV